MPGTDHPRLRGRDAELDAYCARQGDAEIARLLALVLLPAVEQTGGARALVHSAIARLVRADEGELSVPAAGAVCTAVKAVSARGAAVALRARPQPSR
ncbi:MAG TPA: hypothetical protein VLU43_04040 [Anaeromyxobacteraceae bacterium]|nr:hypothetical protein [Anaeromyxobacteraceae bacterium]